MLFSGLFALVNVVLDLLHQLALLGLPGCNGLLACFFGLRQAEDSRFLALLDGLEEGVGLLLCDLLLDALQHVGLPLK